MYSAFRMLTEEFLRHQLRLLFRHLGLPEAKDIGQHEIVSSEKLGSLDAMAHDEAVLLRALVGLAHGKAFEAFQAVQGEFRVEGLRTLSESSFQSRFLETD